MYGFEEAGLPEMGYSRAMKNPVLVGVVNAILPGLGYLIIKERVVFGWLMLVGMVLFSIVMLTDPSPAFATMLFAVSETGKILEGISYVLIVLGFAYDAYDLARRKLLATSVPPSA